MFSSLYLRGAQVIRHYVTPTVSKNCLSYRPLLRCIQNCQISTTSRLMTPQQLGLSNRQCTTLTPIPYGHRNVYRTLPQGSSTHMQVRTVTKYSKLGKRKTVKAVAKRFIRTGSGKLKYWPPGKVHNMLAKSRKRRLQLRKPRYATKTQLKTLNKMISGW